MNFNFKKNKKKNITNELLNKDIIEKIKKNKLSDTTIFGLSFYTLRFKLVIVVVSLIAVSLIFMAIFSTSYFSTETKIRIQEYNLNLAQTIASEMTSELNLLSKEAKLIDNIYLINKKGAYKFFLDNKNFVFYSRIDVKNDKLILSEKMNNDQFLKDNKIILSDLEKSFSQYTDFFKRAKKLGFSIFNATLNKVPLLGLCVKKDDKLILLYIYPESIFDKFGNNGIVTTFMTDALGNIVAHRNREIFINRLNASSSPLVKSMTNSQLSSVQLSYKDTDNKDYLGSYSRLEKWELGVVAYVPEKVVFDPIRKLILRNSIILIAVLTLALLFIYFFAKTILVPIQELMKATKDIENGIFQTKIKPIFKDEIGSLTFSFVNMAKGLSEREKIKDAFGRFVNKDIAEKALSGEIKLGGEKKYASVFFSDLRNFTSISEKMNAEDVVRYLNEYFTEMVACIDKTNGIVDKYIGDAIMAHWGAINQTGNETEEAIDAALAMRKALITFNQKNKWPLTKIGCGINTGEVVSGQIGSEIV